MKLRSAFFHTVCLCSVLPTFLLGQAAQPVQPAPVADAVEVLAPGRGNVTRYLNLPASLRADQQVALYARVSGFLKTIAVDVGDSVKAGQLLAELEVPELSADVARYEAEMEVAATATERIEAARSKSPDLITPAAADEARGRYRIAKANLQRTQTLLGYSRIVAPFDGVITLRTADVGAYVAVPSSSSPSGAAAVLTVVNTSTVRVVVAVPEVEAALVRVGLPVRITIDTIGGKVFAAKVSRLSGVLSESTRTMVVEADLPNADGGLRAGMYVRAGLGLETHNDVMTLPVKAVLIEKSGPSVFLVTEGKVKKIPVVIGFNDGERIEIVGGLSESQSVIVLGKTPPVAGQSVIIREAK
jgi:RND family efflux transporter MFP subunit